MKNVLLMTLKFLVEQLQFFESESPMQVLWPVIETLFQITEKCRRKEVLRESALQLQAVIAKACPGEYYAEKVGGLLKAYKAYFEAKRTYGQGMQLVLELCQPRAVAYNKH